MSSGWPTANGYCPAPNIANVGVRCWALRSTPRDTSANLVEALLDCGKARFDERFELVVGEDVGPVVLDAFADQLADIERIDALGDAVADEFDALGYGAGGRRPADLAGEALRQIAARIDDLGADEARAQHRDADAARRQFEPQALRQRDHAVLGDVVGDAAVGDQAGDRGGRDDVPALAVPLDQRAEDLDAPDDGPQVHAQRPVPRGIAPHAVGPAAADAGSPLSEMSARTPSMSALVNLSFSSAAARATSSMSQSMTFTPA